MDRYFTVIKSTAARPQDGKDLDKDKKSRRYAPYSDLRSIPKSQIAKASSSVQKKYLLSTLEDESNPITHSDIADRTDFVVSMSTGHQISDTPGPRREYHIERTKKLARQQDQKSKKVDKDRQILCDTRIYIDGYLEGTTDIEMKRIITTFGGQVLNTASNATHILTSQSLSGSKIHRILTKKLRVPVKVVRPEWIWDSLEAGKRLSEFQYVVVKSSTTRVLS